MTCNYSQGDIQELARIAMTNYTTGRAWAFSREDWNRVCESLKALPPDASEADITAKIKAAILDIVEKDDANG